MMMPRKIFWRSYGIFPQRVVPPFKIQINVKVDLLSEFLIQCLLGI
jgi:hypothetical protein